MDHLPTGICSKNAYNATWFYKISTDPKVKPKDIAIEYGKKLGHSLFLERQEGKSNYRCYGSYESVKTFSDAVHTQNLHMYEIISDHVAGIKFYADIDGENDDTNDVIDTICIGFKEEFGISVCRDDFYVSTANGVSDFAGKKNVFKYSSHIILNKHETIFKDKKNIQYFLSKYNHPSVDLAVYSKNQSFKMIFQSKFGSDRIQIPVNGGFSEHLITNCSEIPKKILSCKRVVLDVEKRLKAQTLYTISVKRLDNPYFPKDTFDKHSIKDLLEHLPNSGEHEQDFGTWFKVMCVCKNENEPVDTFLQWSRQYSGHDDDEVLKRWDEIQYRPDGYTIKMLHSIITQANPLLFKHYDEKFVHQICYPTVNFEEHKIDSEVFHSRYLPCLAKYLDNYKHLIVRSYLGTGKSTQNNAIIQAIQPKSILVMSPRILFSYSIVGNIKKVCPKMKIYREIDKEDRYKFPYMACQVESLYTIGNQYDLVIIDESESILNQFSSETNEYHFKDNVRKFDIIIKNAKHVVWSDAFITDRTMLTVHHFVNDDERIMFVDNTWKPTDRKRVYVGNKWDYLSKYIKNKLIHSKTVTVSSNTSLVKDLKESLPNNFALYAGCDDDIKYKLTNPDEAVRDKQHLVYTPALNVGTDIQVPFDYRCVYLGANSAVVRDLFQAMERVRNFNKTETFYALYPKYHGKKATDIFDRTRLDTILMKKHGDDKARLQLFEDYPWIRKVCVMNIQEQNVSAKCFTKVCNEYFNKCGYVKAEVEQNDTTNAEIGTIALENTCKIDDFDEIQDIDMETYSDYYLNIQCGRASEIEKLMVLKYHFKHFIIRNVEKQDPETVKCVWNGFLSNKQRMIEKVCNLKYEIGGACDDGTVASDPLFNNRANKLKHIQDICTSLGINNSYTCANVERSLVEATCEKLLQIKTEIKEQFGIPLEETSTGKTKASVLKRGVQLLNAVLERWGFTNIKQCGKRKQIRVNGERVDTTPYILGVEGHGKMITESHM